MVTHLQISPRRSVQLICGWTVLIAVSLLPSGAGGRAGPSVPVGFYAGVYASGFVAPTALAFGPDGRLYVAQQNGLIIAIGRRSRTVVASGFTVPLGLAWHSRTLYVSATGQVSTLTPSKNYRSFTRRLIITGLPTGRHQNDGMAFSRGWMYLGVGSTCDACVEKDARSASILRFAYNGTHAQVFAHGLRNPYGLAFRPRTNLLYATDNGRDDHGNSVPDELNMIVHDGRYGWPDCWGNGGGTNCAGTIPPVVQFEPHASADGLTFYTGRSFPKSYAGDAFVAEWGDDITTLGTGQRVKRVHFAGTQATASDFVTGLAHPLAVVVAPSGALLIADFATGIIWSVQANGH